MATQTLTLAGKRFVILPESEYRQLTGKRSRTPPTAATSGAPKRKHRMTKQDRGDVAEAIRRSKQLSIPYSELRKELGLA
jgi:predicted DNA-binding transcriptional regulator YafY